MNGNESVARLHGQLDAFVRAQVGEGAPEISGLSRLGVGRSRENWIFDARWPDGRTEPLILRQDPTGGLVETDRAVEFAVLEALAGSGIGAPRALWLDAGAQWLDRPSLVMHREPGVCEYDVLNGELPLATRTRLAHDFCDLMVAVHELDWRALKLGEVLPDPGERPSLTELRHWEQILRRDQVQAYPELELVLDHLASTAPPCAAPTLVHADFKPGNILLDGSFDGSLDGSLDGSHDGSHDGSAEGTAGDEHITALLDWELVHLGDPLEDLGWVTQPLRTREHLIRGAWEREDLIAHYAKSRGVEVDPDAVAWWNVFAGFKTAVMQVSGLRAFLDARSDDFYRPHPKVLRALLTACGPTPIGGSHATHS